MKQIRIGNSDLYASQLVLGMMRSSAHDADHMQRLLEKALELDINFLDHADVYRSTNIAEEVFGQVMVQAPHLRDKFIIQTKCGICNGYFDSSYEHIMEAVDQSLRRMHIEQIDSLLIHRPDALMEPEEIAKAFDQLHASGKVRYFGVSNMNPSQIELIKSCVTQPLITDQVEMSIVHAPMIDSGIFVNMTHDRAIMREGDLLNYSRLNGITLQCWSILQINLAENKGTFIDNPDYPELNKVLADLAEKYGVTKAAIAVAWILRHPANLMPVAGTVDPVHLEELSHAFDFTLSRQEWYQLYLAVGRPLP